MVLDLPMPGASSSPAASAEDDGPVKKKLKLGSGGEGGLTGLAAMLPKPKHESVAVKLEKALGSAGSSARVGPSVGGNEEGAEKPKPAGPAFVTHSLSKGKAKASAAAAPAEPEVDFFGLGEL